MPPTICYRSWERRLLLALSLCFTSTSFAAEGKPMPLTQEQSRAEYERAVAPLLKQHCQRCHGEDKAEAELVLLKLDPNMQATSAARWAMVLDQLTQEKMPPPNEPQPSLEMREAMMRWITAELKRVGKHVARREMPANGNSVPHELLFGSSPPAPFDSATRLRRISPEIYTALTNEIAKDTPNIGQPFTPAGKSVFKDMGAPLVDEPTTQLLMLNALALVEKQTAHKLENGEIKKLGQMPDEFLKLFDPSNPPNDTLLHKALTIQFERVLKRKPAAEEMERLTQLYKTTRKSASPVIAARYMLAAVYLLPEAIFRSELGGEPDAQGRVRLTSREIAAALAFALTDRKPEAWLLAAAEKNELATEEQVADAVRRMLNDSKLEKPRILRFFREYFGYHLAKEVFKDERAHPAHDARVLIEDTDKLVLHIFERDQQVLRELLTTNEAFVAYKTAADTKKKRAEALAKFEAEKAQNPEKFKDKKPNLPGRPVFEAYNLSDFPDEQPVRLPKQERAGILTQPAWLVAWSKSEENHAIYRGKWVRERLLGGVVPDVPITVDAQLPNAPEQSLRTRMQVTQHEYCWKCHTYMNRLGLPFEMYDHLGRYRVSERVLDLERTAQHLDKKGQSLGLVYKEVPVDSSGGLEHTDEASLSGDISNAVELLRRLAESERVEQVFVRHAFRYWMGRNETPGDAPSLQAAHRAYRAQNGSMKALIVALLTSDSFLYRMPAATTTAAASELPTSLEPKP